MEKKRKKTPPNHNSLIDYCLQKNEWMTTVKAIRAQSKNNCADKQMESQTTVTNINLN